MKTIMIRIITKYKFFNLYEYKYKYVHYLLVKLYLE